uniref:Protein KASH5 EF-hand-like domain-containing protein n=1 Tax=Eptatretus burgeri TaxID=7764 RepID=A0A8C4R8L0_EPTBU
LHAFYFLATFTFPPLHSRKPEDLIWFYTPKYNSSLQSRNPANDPVCSSNRPVVQHAEKPFVIREVTECSTSTKEEGCSTPILERPTHSKQDCFDLSPICGDAGGYSYSPDLTNVTKPCLDKTQSVAHGFVDVNTTALCGNVTKIIGGNSFGDVSLITDEDILKTMFMVCDVRRTGCLTVPIILDFVRDTINNNSDDCGLERLSNMLDPERQGVSIDLPTFLAIMEEWIQHCRQERPNEVEDAKEQIVSLSMQGASSTATANLSTTVGSLEAAGGDISNVEPETTELMSYLAVLQHNNRRQYEEIDSLRRGLDAAEDGASHLSFDKEH